MPTDIFGDEINGYTDSLHSLLVRENELRVNNSNSQDRLAQEELSRHIAEHQLALSRERDRIVYQQYSSMSQQLYNTYINATSYQQTVMLNSNGEWQKYESKPKAKKESKIPWL